LANFEESFARTLRMKYFFSLILAFGSLLQHLSAQNLVINGSFEEHIGCVYHYLKDLNACNFNPLARAVVEGWFTPADRRADYFHPCNTADGYTLPRTMYGHVYPADGQACVGIWYYRDVETSATRDYIIGTLREPLQAGKTYYVAYKVRLSEHSQLAGPAPGVWITSRKLKPEDLAVGYSAREPQISPDTAQFIWDKTRWYTITGSFKAEGGEKYIVMGYFGKKKDPPLLYLKNDGTTGFLPECYYLLDDVYVGLEPLKAEREPKVANRPLRYVPYKRGYQWLEGRVSDFFSGAALPGAEVLLYERGHPERAEKLRLNKAGLYRTSVPRGRYVVVARHAGYLPRAIYSESAVLEETLDLKLVPVKKGNKMQLLSYYTYEDGTLQFQRFSPEELREVAAFLAENPNIKIQINSQGYRQRNKTESPEDIQYETEARAREIADFLTDAGALGYQVSCKGYGASRGSGFADEIEITDILKIPDKRPRFPLTILLTNQETKVAVSGSVTLVNKETGFVKVFEVPEGRALVKIPSGSYTITAGASGFMPASLTLDMPLDEYSIGLELMPIENNTITVRNISFPPNSTQPDPNSYPILDQIVQLMRLRPEISLSIEGHTDGSNERTSDEYLNELSLRRAEGVKEYLVSKGVQADRIQCVGYGRSRPVADNNTPEGRMLNRRIEFKIIE